MGAVSVKDVAALAGVSIGTVSNVLNRPERVAAATVARVHDAIDKLGYVRNDAARQLRAGHSRSIGLVVLDVGNPFFGELVRGAEDAAVASGFTVLVTDSRDDPTREATQVELFEEQRVRGLLLSPIAEAWSSVERLRARGIPVVLVDRALADASISSVSVDDVYGGELAVGHLIERGRERIAFVGGPMTTRQVTDRLEGARKAISQHRGVSFDVIETSDQSVLAGRHAGERIVAMDPADRPDAVFAANDLLAFGILQGLILSAGVRVPDEIMLVGYDDIDFAQAAIVPLSSVRQPARLIGETGIQLLLAEAEGAPGFAPKQVVYQPTLIERASTGGP
ncbi:LacI family DNA-binding transcriptional regulator [Stackebrandtia soli]|uniref:LacI family DNA-binding transcriptional regulator n=1 Tax=Stackebrandtia soli TaxID=1892856 RepID=UPI0039E7F1A6